MSDELLSSIAYKSNIQPVKQEDLLSDASFLKHIHDPFALEILYKKDSMYLDSLQKKEFDYASMHCAYAYKDDYPWGTVNINEKDKKVVCKCTKTDCIHFKVCRSDFDPSELDVVSQNSLFVFETQQFEKSVSSIEKQSSDEVAFENVLSYKETHESSTDEHKEIASEKERTNAAVKNKTEDVKHEKQLQKPVEKKASFSSFKTVEQEDIISADPVERTIVNAGPGTGKTYTLIEKLKYMLNDMQISGQNIMVLCFSKAAVEVVRNRLDKASDEGELTLDWVNVEVRTFDSFATYLIAFILEQEPELLYEGYSLESQNYDQRIQTAIEILNKDKGLFDNYEHVIVDEVQDLVADRAKMVLTMLGCLPASCGFTLLGDSCQALYDYMAKDDANIMSSTQFYDVLFDQYREANFYSLEHNFRQGDSFGSMTVPYRKAILSGDEELQRKEAEELCESVKTTAIDIHHLSIDDARRFTKKGTLGILTRTNGQALQISAWLMAEGVNHRLQRRYNPALSSWIKKVFDEIEGEVLERNDFEEIFGQLYPDKENQTEKYWQALAETQQNSGQSYFEVDDLIKGLITNARSSLLYEDPEMIDLPVTVSNIHRAKGKEFDTVLVLNDVLASMADEEQADDQEHKVCYVALTRPKKVIEKIDLETQYIYISKDAIRRCFKSGGRRGHLYLSHFEVGMEDDFDNRSFARDIETQEYILNQLSVGDRLKLIKCDEGTKSYVIYKLVPEENEHVILGYTNPEFARSMERAIQRIYDNHHHIDYKYFPNIFADIYIDGFTTEVSCRKDVPVGAHSFVTGYYWTGLSVTGFARMEKDRY